MTICAIYVADVNDTTSNFLAVHVHCIDTPRRLYGNAVKSIQGVYTDGIHTLIRIDIDTITLLNNSDDIADGEGSAHDNLLIYLKKDQIISERVFSLVISQRNRSLSSSSDNDMNYTLNVYSTIPFKFFASPTSPPNKVESRGCWTPQTCGNPSHATFAYTPQYRLIIPPANTSMHVHVQILYPKEVCYMLIYLTLRY